MYEKVSKQAKIIQSKTQKAKS